MKSPIRVVQVGLGPVGQMLTQHLAERKFISIVGAVDVDPVKKGMDIGEFAKPAKKTGIRIRPSLKDFEKGEADIAAITTTSTLESIAPVLETAARKGMGVVSTCEELVYPWRRQPALAKKIDAAAKEGGVAILGTGVNPGYLMDFLPVALTAVCRSVTAIRIERIQDASRRRIPFQRKIGTGMTPEEFRSRVEEGKLGHVGLAESMDMIAAHLGWKLDQTDEATEPVLAERSTPSGLGTIPPEKVIGLLQRARGRMAGKVVLALEFRAVVGSPESRDTVYIDGLPGLSVTIPEGVQGDVATCAIVTNAIPVVMGTTPGLKTMIDLPPVSWRA
ncbi:MAG TPA: dihydrodipicolinate reductase [Bdellovibrionota bacterium]|nr:dihydrodipicolinate reductase [Bdellovibrionota bacterium]